ncbi:MAG: hypothetical protein K9M97_07485 [Akkermansiaceae bacterium]|nr:hypothetical protein [Akkermansiaceae bacterium]
MGTATAAAKTPEGWLDTATQGLVRELRLNPEQERQVREQLLPVRTALHADQERALFQMHLRRLLFHDSLAASGALNGAQTKRLGQSRAKLKNLIIGRFPDRPCGNPVLAGETSGKQLAMKSSHWLVLASAITGCAVALGSYLMWDGGPENRQQTSPGGAKHPTTRDTRQDWRRTTEARHRQPDTTASRTRSRADTATPRTIPAASALRVTGQPPQGEVSETEWFASAAKVEQEANREVHRLAQMVGLDADQQVEIFGVVARNSSSWLPGMQTGGGVDQPAADSGLSEADQVMAYLNADPKLKD